MTVTSRSNVCADADADVSEISKPETASNSRFIRLIIVVIPFEPATRGLLDRLSGSRPRLDANCGTAADFWEGQLEADGSPLEADGSPLGFELGEIGRMRSIADEEN